MGEFQQVKRAMDRARASRVRRGAQAQVVDLAAWKRRRASEEAGRYGVLRRVQYPTRGPA